MIFKKDVNSRRSFRESLKREKTPQLPKWLTLPVGGQSAEIDYVLREKTPQLPKCHPQYLPSREYHLSRKHTVKMLVSGAKIYEDFTFSCVLPLYSCLLVS
jgi:hypothetical protein